MVTYSIVTCHVCNGFVPKRTTTTPSKDEAVNLYNQVTGKGWSVTIYEHKQVGNISIPRIIRDKYISTKGDIEELVVE